MARRVLLITGAGASRNLGEVGKPLPLMGGWGADIVDRLNRHDPTVAPALGLVRDLEGDKFEECLGNFIRWERSIARTAQMSALGEAAIDQPANATFVPWRERAKMRTQLIYECVYNSMYANLGNEKISTYACGKAYQILVSILGLDQEFTLSVATTNYDSSVIEGLESIGLHPDSGEHAPTMVGGGSPPVNIEGLSGLANGSRVPVLYLHGRLGWYVNQFNRLVSHVSSVTYNETAGSPGLLLPDPNKDYASDPHFALMWSEFSQLVHSADRILVLGHSLHDPELARLIVAAGKVPVTRVVGWSEEDAWPSIEEGIMNRLSGVRCIRWDFGPEATLNAQERSAFQMWLNGQ